VRATLLSFIGTVALSGCALLGKSEPLVPRYFTPEYDGDAVAAPARSELQLRLGRVEGWSHLRERMAARNAAREFFYYEDRRWTERPEIYLRRALTRTLFEERGVVEALSGRAVTLEVELIAFEEIEQPHRARMQAWLVLRDDRIGLLEETITVEQPVAKSEEPDQAGAVAEALSQALHAGVTRIADHVVAKLAAQASQAAK
jgi:cholesterol transport system auxiliary component